MTIQYIKAESLMHRMSPIAKLIYVLLTLPLVLIVTRTADILMLLVWLVYTLILWQFGKIRLRYLAKVFRLFLFVCIFIIVIQGFMYARVGLGESQTPLFSLPWHYQIAGGADLGVFTLEGFLFGIMIVIRVITAVCALPLLIMTTSPSKLLDGLSKVKVPFSFAFMLVTAIRFVPMVDATWSRIVEAQKLRAFNIDKMNFIKKAISAYIPITTPLVLILLRQANDLEIAIESRGFGAPEKRTFMEDVGIHAREIAFLAITALVYVFCLWFKFNTGAFNTATLWVQILTVYIPMIPQLLPF
jgi:energy-coupling factor transport system permease protein